MALVTCDFFSESDFRPGEHVWPLWHAVIQDVVAWLPARPSLG
jgi:S-formylglutathione hydrolase FrmB